MVLLVFAPGLLEQFEAPKAVLVRAFGFGVLAFIAATARGARGGRIQPLDLAVIAGLAVEAVTTVFSVAPRLSLFGDLEQHEGLFTSIGMAGIYAAGRFAPPDSRRTRTALTIGIAGAAVACLYAIAQAAGLDPFTWTQEALYGASGNTRPFGTLGHANLLGAVSAAALAASLPLIAWETPQTLALLLSSAALAVGTLLTLSRSAWLGALAGVLVGLVLRGRAQSAQRERSKSTRTGSGTALRFAAIATAVAVVVAVMAALGFGGLVRQRAAELLAPGSGSARSRLEIWRAALACWRARPWLGSGPDTFLLVFPRFQTSEYWRFEWGSWPAHAHSIYLHLLATRGVAGIGAAAGLAVALLATARRTWRSSPNVRIPLASLLAAVAALAVAGAFGALGLGGAALLAVTLGTVASLSNDEGGGASRASEPRARTVAWIVAGLAFAACVPNFAGSWYGGRARSEWPLVADPARAAAAGEAANHAVASDRWDDEIERVRARTFFAVARASASPLAPLVAAEASARRSIQLAPLRATNYEILGNVLMAKAVRGDSTARPAAEAAYDRCMKLAPRNAMAALEWANEELALGRVAEALAIARTMAELYPRVGLPQLMLAQASLAAGDLDVARSALQRARDGDWPASASGREWATSLLDSLGDPGSTHH